MPAPRPAEFRRRAVELAREGAKPIAQLARELGMSESGLRRWMAQAEIDDGKREGLSSSDRAELVKLRRENRILQMENEILKEGGGLFRQGERPPKMIYPFIAGHCSDLPVVACCRVMKVSVSGFYEWQHRQAHPSSRRLADRELTEIICEIWRQSRGTYGSPRVWAELRLGRGVSVSRKRVERLMRLAGIEGIYRRRRRRGCTRRNPQAVLSDDLINRNFHPGRPDRLWVADATEHPTEEGKVYLAVVLDAWSRRIVGWSIADHLRTELVVDALEMACWRRRPQPGELIHHADHGSQYTSWAFGQRLRRAGLLGSMGTVGDALDNAMAESFFATLQLELLDRRRWQTRRELAQAIFEYIEVFYNPERRHSRIGYLSPIEYERRHTAINKVA
ncbi:MAG: IS3 family transposase [Actinobacteria bacterium]|nr:IS3 family transposase [Actinomycetota bacterium]